MKKRYFTAALAAFIWIFALMGCRSSSEAAGKEPAHETALTETADAGTPAPSAETESEEDTVMTMNVTAGDRTFSAVLENNPAADALVEMMESGPVSIEMRDYSGFEKVGSLGKSLPAQDSRTTTQAGDIVLYQGDQIVVFYGSNSWSYTRLGHIQDLSGWEEALGDGSVTITFSLEV